MGGFSMNEMDFFDAISSLTNGVGFRISGTDLDTLEIADKSAKPTLAQIEAKIVELQNDRTIALAAKATEKAALLSKLGITDDEAKLLLS
jgi:hypothetical protein